MNSKYPLDGLSRQEIRILDRLAQQVASSRSSRKLTEQEIQTILVVLRQQSEGDSWVN